MWALTPQKQKGRGVDVARFQVRGGMSASTDEEILLSFSNMFRRTPDNRAKLVPMALPKRVVVIGRLRGGGGKGGLHDKVVLIRTTNIHLFVIFSNICWSQEKE